MEHLVDYCFQTLHRFHNHKFCFQTHGDLAMVEFFILLGISAMKEKREEPLTLSDIIEVTGMSMSAASKKISILEKKGFLSRCVSETDKRKYDIALTEQGKALCEKERLEKRAWIQEVISRLGEEDTKEMLRLLNKMFDVVEDIESQKTV